LIKHCAQRARGPQGLGAAPLPACFRITSVRMTSFFAHDSAFVDTGARVGDSTKIWHFCHVRAGAVIGRGCTLGQNVYVAESVEIGDGVKIQNNVSIYAGVILEDEVFCGPSMVFTNVRTPRAAFPRQAAGSYSTTRVCRGATIGANATVICGVTVGKWAFVAAGSLVTRDVPDYGFVIGVPSRLRGWACQCGLRLSFSGSSACCAECGRRYVLNAARQVELSS
jgi:UDP-2-acetamido-3-amino-2,3-dideoxy-glucuronate N-acetyltransferase